MDSGLSRTWKKLVLCVYLDLTRLLWRFVWQVSVIKEDRICPALRIFHCPSVHHKGLRIPLIQSDPSVCPQQICSVEFCVSNYLEAVSKLP